MGPGEDDWPRDAFRSDSRRSMTFFSLTTLSGTSSSPSTSKVDGSGKGPSMTQRLSSYLVRMKFSILASDGACPDASFASQYLFARALPQLRTLCSCSSVQESRSTDLTRLMWVPMPRWMPEQRMQTKTPRFHEAHLGSARGASQYHAQGVSQSPSVGEGSRLLRLQSAHTLLASNFRRLLIVCVFCAARSAAGFAGRRLMAVRVGWKLGQFVPRSNAGEEEVRWPSRVGLLKVLASQPASSGRHKMLNLARFGVKQTLDKA